MTTVRAAGGIVVRNGATGPEVVVIHRPAQDDWSFPKGKAKPGESDELCALREVAEETGLLCELGVLLGEIRYRDARRRPKRSLLYLMRPITGEFRPSSEVDEMRWVTLEEAAALLTYPRDLELLERSRERISAPLDAVAGSA